jgi:probable selenium-dependent hydroxylase accessory protein YqeC
LKTSDMPRLSELLGLATIPARRGALVLAFVGAGGKTSAMFALARELRDSRLVATTTTRLRDPRSETGRPIDRVVVDPRLADAVDEDGEVEDFAPRRGGGALVLASAAEQEGQKLIGIRPSRVGTLRAVADFVLVEADGSRGLPIKAPAAWEPVVPDCADLVVGLVGLDCLGEALGPEIAHRPEILGPLVGCAPGEPLGVDHLIRLARAAEGLFKGSPPSARRAILLNKADALQSDAVLALVDALVEGGVPAEIVIACSLRDGDGPKGIASRSSASRSSAKDLA